MTKPAYTSFAFAPDLLRKLKIASATRGETMAAITNRAVSRELSRYDRYEALKAELQKLPLTAPEYESRLMKLADECGV